MRKREICRFGGGGGGGGGATNSSGSKHGGSGNEAGSTLSPVPTLAPGVPNMTADQAIQQAQTLYGAPGPQLGVLPQSMFPSAPLSALYQAIQAARMPQQYSQPALNPQMQMYNRPVQ